MNATTRDTSLLTRPAMRFILRHRRGLLAALDHETGRTVTGNVHYKVDASGRLIGYLTSGHEVLEAIHARAAVSLTVEADGDMVGEPTDETGMPTEFAIERVAALVDAQVIDHSDLHVAGQTQPLATVTLDIYDIEVTTRDAAAS